MLKQTHSVLPNHTFFVNQTFKVQEVAAELEDLLDPVGGDVAQEDALLYALEADVGVPETPYLIVRS